MRIYLIRRRIRNFVEQIVLFASAPRYVREIYWRSFRKGQEPLLVRKDPEDMTMLAPAKRWAPITMYFNPKGVGEYGEFK